ncbi:MAG TPA: sugar phosphate isomerase/epimerase [Rhizomicrobium sp.]|jgi:sugar phosphate isomerase/epimerase|nr:sugar phosphate isomerase/epimerase [Rhizomicrobium sp.]
MTDRRQFLVSAAGLMAAAATPTWAQGRPIPLGLQLYTVRQDLARDYDGTMRQLRAIGIRNVQANLTMSGKSSADQKKLYDSLGISWKSIHAGGDALRGNIQPTIDEAAKVGITNITCSFPLFPIDRAKIMAGPTLDDWKRNAETFNKCGQACKAAGMTFGYHNHNLEFRKIGAVVPYDLLLKQTDPSLVLMEMDIGWVVAGGADPAAYLTKYPTRFHSLHIKDLKNQGIPNTNMKMTSAIIGQGIIDWKKLIPVIHKTSVEHAFLEIEEPYVPSPMGMVKASFEYLHGKV